MVLLCCKILGPLVIPIQDSAQVALLLRSKTSLLQDKFGIFSILRWSIYVKNPLVKIIRP